MKRLNQRKYEIPSEHVFNNAIATLRKIRPIIYTDNFRSAIELISKHRVWITGAGKAALLAEIFATTLACNNIQATYLDSSQALHGGLGVVRHGELMIILSNSGKTDEIIQIAQKLIEKDIKIIVITGSLNSPLGQLAGLVLDYGPISEACSLGLTPTTSLVIILSICDALAMSVQKIIGTTYNDYAWNHHKGWIGVISRQKAKHNSGNDITP